MKIVELILDENDELNGIEAISIVESPAIEEDFVALKDAQDIELKKIDEEKQILLGPILIPNKPILRKGQEDNYYIYFSRDTVRKASELYLKNGNQGKSTLEHQHSINGLTLVESWIVEDKKKDKSQLYDMDVPLGTWMGTIRVDNKEIWDEYVKSGKVKGFSIEGYFADKSETPQEKGIKDRLSEIEEEDKVALIESLKSLLKGEKQELESYSDYGEGVKNNAKRGIELNQKVGNKCATQVGKVRGRQLSKGVGLTLPTIKRMYSYLSRAETYYDPNDTKACGTISYLLWGGLAGKSWGKSKLKELGELKLESKVIDKNFAIIDDRLGYASKEMADKVAKDIGCTGSHEHEFEGKTWYMPCEKHIMKKTKSPCWDGYRQDGYKMKGGKRVPNCVKIKDDYAKVGKKGGIVPSKKAPKSGTKNPNPKGKGTAKGTAKGKTGAKVSAKDRATLQKKADEFNEKYKQKLGYGVTVGQLSSVYQRGLGAFNTSHSPNVSSASQWAFARVNAFLYLIKNGRPQNAKYITDYDLLPKKHPKSSKK
tara:strand:+ start:954 stop:2573 length:1620 start_codon:yes stop_codon:yes gene_type:complete